MSYEYETLNDVRSQIRLLNFESTRSQNLSFSLSIFDLSYAERSLNVQADCDTAALPILRHLFRQDCQK